MFKKSTPPEIVFDEPLSQYERERQHKIQKNKEFLESMGIVVARSALVELPLTI